MCCLLKINVDIIRNTFLHDYLAYCVSIHVLPENLGLVLIWFCICIVFLKDCKLWGNSFTLRAVERLCSSVNAVVHSHFCTSEEMQQLILSHWDRASQICKCGHSRMKPLTSVCKSEIIEQPAPSFLLKERQMCIGSFLFLYFFLFYRKNSPLGLISFFIVLLVRAKKK